MSEDNITATPLWTRYCDGFTVTETEGDVELIVTCYETEQDQESPRVQDGLLHLWRFEEGGGSQVSDWKGGAHLTIAEPGAVEWIEGGGLRILEATALTAEIAVPEPNGGLTLEAWIKPAQVQWGRVFSWSEGKDAVNLELRQNSGDWLIRCRGEPNGAPSLATTGGLAISVLVHLVWTLDVQSEALYLNTWQARGGDRTLADFGNFPLIVGNTPAGDRAWLGELHLLALYDWALPEVAIQQNYEAGPHPEKVPVGPDAPTSLVEAVRTGAWRRTGIPRNDGAALLKHARNGKLGAPITREFVFEFGGTMYVAQGFAGAIAYCQDGDWGNVLEMAW